MISAEQIAELEVKYQRIGHLRGKVPAGGTDSPWECVFRKPSRAEYKMFRSRSHNPSQVADAQEALARACVVHPSKEAFDALLEDYPGIPEAAGNMFKNLVGMAAEEDVK